MNITKATMTSEQIIVNSIHLKLQDFHNLKYNLTQRSTS